VDPPRLAKLVVGILPVAILLVAWPQFADADATYRDLDAVIAVIPKNSAVAQLGLDRPIFKTRVYSATVGPARVVCDRGGRSGLSLAMSPIAPVQLRPEYRWDEYDRRTIPSGSRGFQPARDLDRFGWVIAQSRDLGVRGLVIAAMWPDAELEMTRGEWLLFRSKHPQLPLTSPDGAPDPKIQSVAERMRYFAERHRRLKAARPSNATGELRDSPSLGEPEVPPASPPAEEPIP
jgi:hypothetical protein